MPFTDVDRIKKCASQNFSAIKFFFREKSQRIILFYTDVNFWRFEEM